MDDQEHKNEVPLLVSVLNIMTLFPGPSFFLPRVRKRRPWKQVEEFPTYIAKVSPS